MTDPKEPTKTETTPLVDKESLVETKNDSEPTPTVMEDAKDTLVLGVPIFIAMLSFVGMKTTDTAILGHVSLESLSAAALSDMWTMCSGVLIQGRVLGVLVGGAVGASNPKLGGIYLQVSLAVISGLTILVIIAWNFTEQVWVAFGSDAEISEMAGYYASVLSIAIPGQMVFTQLSQFFSAQRIMRPEVNTATFAMIANLIFGLVFVLGIPFQNFEGYGFEACPIVTTSIIYLQLFLIWYIYMHHQKLHEACWDGWDLKEITWARVKTFSGLYFPSALGGASDFWRVAVIGAVAAKLGEAEVAVFNTSYRIMWIVLVLVVALSGASGINMSIRLGNLDPKGAKQAGYVGAAMACGVCTLTGVLVWVQIRAFGLLFTQDDTFLTMFEEARTPFCLTLVFMNVSIALEKIPYSMGRTVEVFWYGFVASWGFQVPGVILCTTYWRADLVGLYTGMAIGYGALVLLYGLIVYKSDWEKQAVLTHERSSMDHDA